VKWFEEALALCRYSESGKKAHVIGGGIIGLEVAEALARRGLKVTVIEALPHILGALLEPDLAEIVNRHLESRGMRIETNTILERIGGKKEVEYVVAKGEKVSTDIVVCAIGMKPNTTLADQIGVQLGQSRAVKPD
jgi:NADPH-dependent 2,4-dienoyl-CoA reductase/sulfur reductase-like enzyme